MYSGTTQKITEINKVFRLARFLNNICEKYGKELFQTVVLHKVDINTGIFFGLNTSRNTKNKAALRIRHAMQERTVEEKASVLLAGARPKIIPLSTKHGKKS